METVRLPDRPEDETGLQQGGDRQPSKGPSDSAETKNGLRKKMSTYGGLFVLAVVMFMLLASEPVQLNGLQVKDIRPDEQGKTLFVAGELAEGRFSGASVSFDAETGKAEVMIKRYQVPFIFGTKEFVAQIKTPPEEIKSLWLVYDDGTGKTDRQQLDWPTSA